MRRESVLVLSAAVQAWLKPRHSQTDRPPDVRSGILAAPTRLAKPIQSGPSQESEVGIDDCQTSARPLYGPTQRLRTSVPPSSTSAPITSCSCRAQVLINNVKEELRALAGNGGIRYANRVSRLVVSGRLGRGQCSAPGAIGRAFVAKEAPVDTAGAT